MRKSQTLAVLVAVMGLSTLPAHAVMCLSGDDRPFELSLGFRFGPSFDHTEREDFDLMRLRQAGVDATRAERWNGCIRAFVTTGTGGEEMQFFEPGSLRRVQ